MSSKKITIDAAKDDWINEIEEEEDDDSFEYLYQTSKPVRVSNLKITKPSTDKLKTVEVGFTGDVLCNKSVPKSISGSGFKNSHSSPQPSTPRLVRLSSSRHNRRNQNSHATNCGFPFIKRGKFRGFYDDRRYRCIYSSLEPIVKCNYSNCHCLHAPIVQSPLKYQCFDYLHSISESEEEEEEEHTDDDDQLKAVDENVNDRKFLSSQFIKKKYKMSRAKLRHEDHTKHTSSNRPSYEESFVSEKSSKRMRRYHSANNLSKRVSLKHHLIEQNEETEAPTLISRPIKAHKHNYLRSFKSIDIGFYKPLTTTV